MAIPLSAVQFAARIRFDIKEDDRLNVESLDLHNKNMFEIFIKDEFLPIYLHENYLNCFKGESISIERSPGKSSDRRSAVGASPMRASTVSGASTKIKNKLDMQRRTTTESKSSPSKAARITLKYIQAYHNVGPQKPNPTITYDDLVEMAACINKSEQWIRSDLRLIFSMADGQLVDEAIEKINAIVSE